MRYGFVLPGGTPAEQLEQAVLADQHGWDAVFVYETHYSVDAWTQLAAIAQRTTHVKLGTMLTPLPGAARGSSPARSSHSISSRMVAPFSPWAPAPSTTRSAARVRSTTCALEPSGWTKALMSSRGSGGSARVQRHALPGRSAGTGR